MAKVKQPNIFEQRRRMMDEASGWAEPKKPKPKGKKPPKAKKETRY